MKALPYLDAAAVGALLTPAGAVEAIEAALRAGLDPGADPPRGVVPAGPGQILLMPSAGAGRAGVKVVTVAPGNPALGLPRIQGLYLLLDPATLAPAALLDGAALTSLRTPAVSVAAVLPVLLRGDGLLRVAVFGAGPQAVAHVATLAAALRARRPLGRVTYLVTRRADRGMPAPDGTPTEVLLATEAGPRVVASADLVVCATTSREPLFDGALVRDDAVVVAVGSHEPDAREVDAALAGRSHVVVEDPPTALRENGNVVQAVAAGVLEPDDLVPMREVVTDRAELTPGRPVLFTSTGMAWEDLVVAAEVHARRLAAPS